MEETNYLGALDHDNEWDEYVSTTEEIDSVIDALREAWKCVPGMTLSQIIDEATPAPFCELSNLELIESLNEFIIQNQ